MPLLGTRTIRKVLDPIEMLTADHERVDGLFDDFERSWPMMKRAIALQICREVEVHATLEEEIFYPAVRQQTGYFDGESIIEQSYQDHREINKLIRKIERSLGSVETEKFAERLRDLRRRIKNHVEHEHSQLFPMAERSVDLQRLAFRMDARRLQLMAKKPTPRALVFLLGTGIVLGLGYLITARTREE
jgi:iron-sulfur cluster repair protein YtfE (RIC family)